MATEHGSARWMEFGEIERRGLMKSDGLILGHMWNEKQREFEQVTYSGEQHLITKAPNRTGKGTCAIIPNLMSYTGSIFCIDPKGENAIVTAGHRRYDLGHEVHILDPWNIAIDRMNNELSYQTDPETVDHEKEADPWNLTVHDTTWKSAGFNPLDMLHPDSPDLVDDARMIADTIIVETGGDSHWSTEAKSALVGFILHVVTSPKEEGHRHLPRVREIMSMKMKDLFQLVSEEMGKHGIPVVQQAANRLLQKSEKEMQSVLSTANANTHFLDSPALQETLKESTFDFGDLKTDGNPIAVYLVLPADRLQTHGRWLRILVSMALTAVVRKKGKPDKSALFILDEMAALGRLEVVEQAFGLMSGFGLRIWAIFQDISQLQDLYKARWQTFIANAGVIQIFGTSDMATARYFSDVMGQKTVEQISERTHKIRTQGEGFFSAPDPNYRSMHDRTHGRPLVAPEELMQTNPDTQIIMVAGMPPIDAWKIPYYRNGRFYEWDDDDGLIREFDQHPDQPVYDGHVLHPDRETRERLAGTEKPRNSADPDQNNPLWGRGLLFLAAFAIVGVIVWQIDACNRNDLTLSGLCLIEEFTP